MALVRGSLFEGKPIVEVAVSQFVPSPLAVQANQEERSFEIASYRALLDTGADLTCLGYHVPNDLGLRQEGVIRLVGGSGPNMHPSYFINIGFWVDSIGLDSGRTLFQLPDPVEAAGITQNGWFDVIIGTDILRNHELRMLRGDDFELHLFDS